MASPPGSSSLFDTEADSPSAKKKLTAAKFKLLARACIDNDLGAGSVYRVLLYAVEKAGAGGRFWKKNSDIADELGIDRATVIRALNKLTLGGYIERIGQHGKLGHKCNVYRIALDLDGAVKAAKREGRRRTSRGATKDERAKAALARGLAVDIGDENRREQVANSTGKPPLRGRSPATPGVATLQHQGSQPCNTISTLPMNPSLEPLRIASLEGKKQEAQQGSGASFEDGASTGKNIASGTIPPGKPSSPFPDDDTNTLGPSTSSLAEPLSSIWTADRLAPGADGVDHAQRSLGPIYMVKGGLEKKEAADHGKVSDALAPLLAAKKVAKAVVGKRKFVERDIELTHRLIAATVPVEFRDGVRRFQYLKWADEVVETLAASIASGGAA